MKRNSLLLIAAVSMALAGCEKNSANVAEKTGSELITFSAEFSGHKTTRAITDEPGKNLIGIFNTTDGIIDLQSDYSNVPYEMGRAGETLYPVKSERTIHVPAQGTRATIIGYTPFDPDIMKLYPLDISSQETSDCQLYYTFTKNIIGNRDNNVKLEFSPVLSKINIHLNGENGFKMETLNGASILFSGLPANANFNLQTSQLQNIGLAADMEFTISDETHTGDCLMIPVSDISGASVTLKLPNIEDDNLKESTYSLSDYTDMFKASTAYDFDFDFTGGKAIFRISETSITNWEDGDNIIIKIPEEDLQ